MSCTPAKRKKHFFKVHSEVKHERTNQKQKRTNLAFPRQKVVVVFFFLFVSFACFRHEPCVILQLPVCFQKYIHEHSSGWARPKPTANSREGLSRFSNPRCSSAMLVYSSDCFLRCCAGVVPWTVVSPSTSAFPRWDVVPSKSTLLSRFIRRFFDRRRHTDIFSLFRSFRQLEDPKHSVCFCRWPGLQHREVSWCVPGSGTANITANRRERVPMVLCRLLRFSNSVRLRIGHGEEFSLAGPPTHNE